MALAFVGVVLLVMIFMLKTAKQVPRDPHSFSKILEGLDQVVFFYDWELKTGKHGLRKLVGDVPSVFAGYSEAANRSLRSQAD